MQGLKWIVASALLASAACSHASVNVTSDRCGVSSAYSMNLGADALVFTRKAPAAQRVEIRRGELRLDGRRLDISSADSRRLLAFEREARALLPEAKALALEAIELAFRAVEQVGVSLSGSDAASRERIAEKLATTRMLLNRRIEAGFDGREPLGAAEIDSLIGDSIAALLPAVAGEIAALAVRAALSGDEAVAADFEARAAQLETQLEREIEGRAEALAVRGQALCDRAAELDAIESALSPALLDGQAFDLIELRAPN
jgi:hypothetical protein